MPDSLNGYVVNSRVRIIGGEFKHRCGIVEGSHVGKGNTRGYLINLEGSPLKAVIQGKDLIRAATVDELFLKNLYKRYMLVRMELMSEILDVMECTSDMESLRSAITTCMHKEHSKCLDKPLDILGFLPDEFKRLERNSIIDAVKASDTDYRWTTDVGDGITMVETKFSNGTILKTFESAATPPPLPPCSAKTDKAKPLNDSAYSSDAEADLNAVYGFGGCRLLDYYESMREAYEK